MGRMIARQPNGLLCVFSSVVDCPLYINLTDEEYIEMFVNEAKDSAEQEAKDNLARRVKDYDEVVERFIPHNMSYSEFKELSKKAGYAKEIVERGCDQEEE